MGEPRSVGETESTIQPRILESSTTLAPRIIEDERATTVGTKTLNEMDTTVSPRDFDDTAKILNSSQKPKEGESDTSTEVEKEVTIIKAVPKAVPKEETIVSPKSAEEDSESTISPRSEAIETTFSTTAKDTTIIYGDVSGDTKYTTVPEMVDDNDKSDIESVTESVDEAVESTTKAETEVAEKEYTTTLNEVEIESISPTEDESQ